MATRDRGQPHRRRVADLRLQLVVEHAELLFVLGEPDTVIDRLREHVAGNPHHERLRVLLITAMHQCGQTADALAQYHDLRLRLADDLGIDPLAQARELYALLLNNNGGQRAGPAAAGPRQPPYPHRLPRHGLDASTEAPSPCPSTAV